MLAWQLTLTSMSSVSIKPAVQSAHFCSVADCSAASLQACDSVSCKVWGHYCYSSSNGVHACSAATCDFELGRLISHNWLHNSDYIVLKGRSRIKPSTD